MVALHGDAPIVFGNGENRQSCGQTERAIEVAGWTSSESPERSLDMAASIRWTRFGEAAAREQERQESNSIIAGVLERPWLRCVNACQSTREFLLPWHCIPVATPRAAAIHWSEAERKAIEQDAIIVGW